MLDGVVRLSSTKQNPVRESQHDLCRKSSTVPCLKTGTRFPKAVQGIEHKEKASAVREIQHKSRLPLISFWFDDLVEVM